MLENTVCDTIGDAQEEVSEASQPNPVSEQGFEPVRAIPGVPATLRVWSANNQLIGLCPIETLAKGDGSHFFRVPVRILLNPGFRVEIEVDVE